MSQRNLVLILAVLLLGLRLSMQKDALIVISPVEDSPAFRAGILPGDQILNIDGELTRNMTLAQAAMVRADGSLKPAGKAWEDLVLHKWWTNAAGKTDELGQYTVRGFLGDYEITVTHEGTIRQSKTSISRTPTVTKIVME